ncbi:MAG: hypothetical protein ACRDYV_15655 [Acidimicrobiia bacterium]
MHTHVVDHRGDRPGTVFSRTLYVHTGLPENPACWLLGHRPCMRRVTMPGIPVDDQGKGCSEAEHRWVECRWCARMCSRAVPPSGAVNESGVLASVDRREGWATGRFDAHVQVHLQSPRPELSVRLHAGTRGSETPWDVHMTVLGSGVYLGLGGIGPRVAEWLSRGGATDGGRDLSLAVHGGRAWWRIWTSPHSWTRGRFASWREASLSVNPLDYLLGGPARYSYEDISPPTSVQLLTAEGTEHEVTLTLQRQTLARRRGPRRMSWVAHWESPGEGIPVRNHAWKGDGILSSALDLPDATHPEGPWVQAALDELREQITRTRRHYDWRPREVRS